MLLRESHTKIFRGILGRGLTLLGNDLSSEAGLHLKILSRGRTASLRIMGIRGPTNISIHQVSSLLLMASIRLIKANKMPKDGVLLQLGLIFGLLMDDITGRFLSLL